MIVYETNFYPTEAGDGEFAEFSSLSSAKSFLKKCMRSRSYLSCKKSFFSS